jgi:hypothetical protein
VRRAAAGLAAHLRKGTVSQTIQQEFAAHVQMGKSVTPSHCDSSPTVASTHKMALDTEKALRVPAWFNADGSIVVADESIMPFPRPPLERAWTECIEYMPRTSQGAHG